MKAESLKTLTTPTKNDFFILDIDSTLLTTWQRNQAIIESFVKIHKDQFPEDCKQLSQARCQLGDYGYKTSLDRMEFSAADEKVLESLDQYWRTNFFSNHFLHEDVPTNGAVQWVLQLHEKGIEFIYLTARHKGPMWDGTLSSMKKMGFPIEEEFLFLKEDLSLTDEEYKAQTLHQLHQKLNNKTLWFIDNEPVVLNKIASEHPHIKLIWFDSTHSHRMKPPEQALRIDSFEF